MTPAPIPQISAQPPSLVFTETEVEPSRLRDASPYLWLVFAAALLGWTFDAMDLNILTLVLRPMVLDLSGSGDLAVVARIGGLIVALKLFAWGAGGIMFGVLTDKFGRARILMITVLTYAVFTGLSATATSVWQLIVFQMIAGLGIGGEWAAGAALVAETWPEKLRPKIMQIMQMGFAFGFFFAAVLNLTVGVHGWRWMFVAGLVPVIATIFIRRFIREPRRWESTRARVQEAAELARRSAKTSGSSRDLTADAANPLRRLFRPDLRRSTVVGVLLGLAMMAGCWGGLTWIPSWIAQLSASPATISSSVSYVFMLLNAGAILGYLSLMWLADVLGRRLTFVFFCSGALIMSMVLFLTASSISAIMWLMPLYGFFAIGGFGIFAIYLPELFPTAVRGTGQGLAWNFARLITGFGVLGSGFLVGTLGSYPRSSAAISLVYVVGLIAVWFGPETKGRPLQDL